MWAYVTPPTIVAGSKPTAANMNKWSTDLEALRDPPRCYVTRAANQTINDSLETAVLFDTELWDTDAMHSTVSNTNRVTINSPGLYAAEAHATWVGVAATTTWREIKIRANGTVDISSQGGYCHAGGRATQQTVGMTKWLLTAGEYLDVTAYHEKGSSTTVMVTFSVARVGGWL